jgi:DNA-binding transcriptional MerR regulator
MKKAKLDTVGLPSSKVWVLLGVPSSTLNYWVQLGLVSPSIRTPQGKRVEQWWTVEEIVIARTIKVLRTLKVPTKEIRATVERLSRESKSLANCKVLVAGSDVILLDGESVATSARRSGQLTLPLAQWHRDASRSAEPIGFDVKIRDRDLADSRKDRSTVGVSFQGHKRKTRVG